MHRFSIVLLFLFLILSFGTAAAQEVTGLSGWSIYLDPGHSQNENVGVFNYSEAHKNLRVGLALRELLLQQTDIDTVYISRTNDQVSVSLAQRVDHANNVGAAHFHSIHSNAAGPSANFLFVLWPQYRDGSEAVPNGGKLMAELMSAQLGRGMRIESLGGRGECDFYGVAECRGDELGTGKGGSRNFVQSFTNMPSELSEAGFHTNPTQNQRNMNADWKRLEAQSLYWAILAYHGLERPDVQIATGIVSNLENGQPINGASVTIGDTTYVTDTFESLFNQYSNDPDELRNGFYYLDGLPGGSLPVTVEADGFEPFDTTIFVVDTFFTFLDVHLVSDLPAIVESSSPVPEDTAFRYLDPLTIQFSRPMDRASVETAFSLTPAGGSDGAVGGNFTWASQDTRLIFKPDSLMPETSYVVRIEDSALGALGHGFDGDEDGVAGGDFEFAFATGPEDVFEPLVTGSYPRVNASDVERRPIISLSFDEPLDPETVTEDRFVLLPSDEGEAVPGVLEYYEVGERSAISFFPLADLEGDALYVLEIAPGLADPFGNMIDRELRVRFRTTSDVYAVTDIDPLEPSSGGVWWEPQQSGSTAGIVTDSTAMAFDSLVVNHLFGSTQSMRLSYGWDVDAPPHLIREYLAGGPPRGIEFDDRFILQVYVFGDGSGNQFRFAVDDQGGHEVSPWVTIDWLGWRPVSWDLSQDSLGTWLGNGTLEVPLNIDSFQLTYADGSPAFGTVWLDDLRLLKRQTTTGTERVAELPGGFELYPNYPNPFNPSTTLRFALSSPQEVTLAIYNVLGAKVATLTDGEMFGAGSHDLTWSAAGLPSGVYFARMLVSGSAKTIQLVLLK